MKTNSSTRFGRSHIEMIRTVINFAFATGNMAITQSIAILFTLISQLRTNLTSIDNLRQIAHNPITGLAAQKKALKTSLVEMSTAIMKSVYTYGVQISDANIMAKMKISRSQLNKMTFEAIVPYIQQTINTVTPLVPAIQHDYNITAPMVAAWQANLTQLQAVLTSPRNAIDYREAINTDIQNLIRQCMLILHNQCDEIVFQLKSTQPSYFNNYTIARKLDSRHQSTQLRAHVADELSQPIAYATVTIDETGISGTTDGNSYCNIGEIPFGTHTVTVTNGDSSQTYGPFDFKKGKSRTEHFTTAPAFASSVANAKTSKSNSSTEVTTSNN